MAATARRSSKSQGLAVAGCNFVAMDQIWRDLIESEHEATKLWPENWGFLTTDYNELVKDEFPNRELDKTKQDSAKNALKNLIQVRPATPLDKYITVLPSIKPVPKTTAGEVGWRSTDRSLTLEKYGSYARPKGNILKQLNWPQDSVD